MSIWSKIFKSSSEVEEPEAGEAPATTSSAGEDRPDAAVQEPTADAKAHSEDQAANHAAPSKGEGKAKGEAAADGKAPRRQNKHAAAQPAQTAGLVGGAALRNSGDRATGVRARERTPAARSGRDFWQAKAASSSAQAPAPQAREPAAPRARPRNARSERPPAPRAGGPRRKATRIGMPAANSAQPAQRPSNGGRTAAPATAPGVGARRNGSAKRGPSNGASSGGGPSKGGTANGSTATERASNGGLGSLFKDAGAHGSNGPRAEAQPAKSQTSGNGAAQPAANLQAAIADATATSSPTGDSEAVGLFGGDLGSEVDSLFDAAVSEGGGEPALAASEEDNAGLQEMFDQMVAMHLRPVRDLMLEVRWGRAPTSWVSHCRQALSAVQTAASELNRDELTQELTAFAAELDAAAKDGSATIGEDRGKRLLERFSPIAPLAPALLSLDDERERREPVLVRSLLLQVADVEHVTIGRLFAAGLSTMKGLFEASADDMALTTGVPRHLTDRIMEKVEEYRAEFGSTAAAPNPREEIDRLRSVLDRLREVQKAYESAAGSWDRSAILEKRRLQKERVALLLRVAVLFARLGETERLDRMERAPVEARLEIVADFLANEAPQRLI